MKSQGPPKLRPKCKLRPKNKNMISGKFDLYCRAIRMFWDTHYLDLENTFKTYGFELPEDAYFILRNSTGILDSSIEKEMLEKWPSFISPSAEHLRSLFKKEKK